jgi:hypothetical protein
LLDLSDTTFLIPVRIDSAERMENLDIVLNYLLTKFNTNVTILEDAKEQNIFFNRTDKRIKYIFNKNDSDIFYRTKLLNKMFRASKTPIIVNYDCDVLFAVEQYVQCVESIRSKSCDLCSPYSGFFYDVPRFFVPHIMNEMTVNNIDLNYCQLMNDQGVGGCIFFNRDSFLVGGMENEHIISWGPDDSERFIRFRKLDFIIKRIEGVLYHLSHPRGFNSFCHNPFYKHNEDEVNKISSMTKELLEEYIKTWEWVSI